MPPVPGILHVLTDPGTDVTLDEFHDWYNNEHGPMRMRFSAVKSGLRYEATDGLSPSWMATYELDNISILEDTAYTQLRENRSPRESSIISRLAVLDRSIYRLITTQGLRNDEIGSVAVTVLLVVPKDSSEMLEQWYIQEHITMLSRVPGWCRSRLLVDTSPSPSEVLNYIAFHEYTESNGLGGPAHEASRSTPWRARIMSTLKYPAIRRVFKLHRVFSKFGNNLSRFSHDDHGVIDTFYTRDDGVMPPRLSDPDPNL